MSTDLSDAPAFRACPTCGQRKFHRSMQINCWDCEKSMSLAKSGLEKRVEALAAQVAAEKRRLEMEKNETGYEDAIIQLEQALETMKINAPISRKEGDAKRAENEERAAASFERAIRLMRDFSHPCGVTSLLAIPISAQSAYDSLVSRRRAQDESDKDNACSVGTNDIFYRIMQAVTLLYGERITPYESPDKDRFIRAAAVEVAACALSMVETIDMYPKQPAR